MRKFILIALTAMLVLGLAATSMAAINGSGQGNGRLSALQLANFQTVDLGNTWINPAYITTYKNKVYGFVGSGSNYAGANTDATANNQTATAWGGAHFDTAFGVWGLWLGRPSDSKIASMDDAVGGNAYTAIPGGATGSTGATTLGLKALSNPNNIDLFYGMDMGAALVGIRVNFATKADNDSTTDAPIAGTDFKQGATSDTVTEDSDKMSAREIGLHFGVALKAIPVGVSVIVGLPSAKSESIVDDSQSSDNNGNDSMADAGDTTDSTVMSETLESDGAMNLGIYANGMVKMSDMTTLVPTVYFESKKNSSKKAISYSNTLATVGGVTTLSTGEASGTREDKDLTMGVDAAFNIKPNDKTLVVSAVGLSSTSNTLKMDNEMTTDNTVAGAVTTNNGTGVSDSIEVKTGTISVPFVVGVENKTFSKVTTRLSFAAPLYKRTKTETTEVIYAKDTTAILPAVQNQIEDNTVTIEDVLGGTQAATVAMGFSWAIGESVSMTAVLNKDIFLSGSYLVSGIAEQLNTAVSFAYSF